ncbi:MAG: hypothetical protein R3E32_10700 [Chitinophagales bacterium]
MTLEILKLEASKLRKSELLDFAQFIIEALKEIEKGEDSNFALSESQKLEIAIRMEDITKNLSAFIEGNEGEEKLIAKYGLQI